MSTFLKNAVSQFAASLALIGLQLVAGVLLARGLSVPDRGVYTLALSFSGLLMVFSELGWSAASIYRIRRLGRPPAQILTAGLWAMGLSSLLAVGVGLIAAPWLRDRVMAGASFLAYLIALLMVPPSLVTRLTSAVARGVDDFKLQNQARVLSAVVQPLGFLALFLLSGGRLFFALGWSLAVQVAFAVGQTWVLARRVGLARRLDRADLAEGSRFGIKSAAMILAGQLHEKIDVFMIAFFLGDSAPVAVYGVAVAASVLPRTFSESLAMALLPTLAGLSPEEAGRFAARVTRQSVAILALLSTGLMAVGPFLLPWLYGSPYRASVVAFLWLTPAIVPLALYKLLARYFTAIGEQLTPFAAQAVSVGLNIGLNALLIPRFGIEGSAAASFLSYTFAAVWVVAAFLKRSGRGVREALVVNREDLALYRDKLTRLRARLSPPRERP